MDSNAPLPIIELPTDPNEIAQLKTQEAPDIDNPIGVETKIHIDGDKIHFERVADVQGVLDQAAALRSAGLTKTGMGDYHIAKIPAIVIEQYCNKHGVTFNEFLVDDTHVTRLMSDPDYKLFRVWEGNL